MDELLTEMRADVTRLPSELGKLTSVSKQLKMDEISTISKLAKGGSVSTMAPPSTQSVITKGPVMDTAGIKKERSEVIIAQKKRLEGSSQSKIVQGVTSGQTVKQRTIQVPSGSHLVQTADGVILYGGSSTANSKAIQTSTVVQSAPSSSSSNQAYTLGVPAAYMDSNSGGIYQAVQLVPVSGSTQQLVYWPTQASQVPVGSQLAVVQQQQQDTQVVQTVQPGSGGSTATGKKSAGGSIITID